MEYRMHHCQNQCFPFTTNTQSKTQNQQSTTHIPQNNIGNTEEMDNFYLSQPPHIQSHQFIQNTNLEIAFRTSNTILRHRPPDNQQKASGIYRIQCNTCLNFALVRLVIQ